MPDIRLRPGGSICTVVPCVATHAENLRNVLENYGMEKLMPEPTTPKAALRAAMVRAFPAPDNKIKHACFPSKNGSDGYKIGSHAPAENVHISERFCEAVAIGKLEMRYLELEEGQKKPKSEWTGGIKLEPYDYDKEREVLGYMRHVMQIVPAGKLRECVTAVIEHLGGRRLIEEQPMLWVPLTADPLFRQIKSEIENASAEKDSEGVAVERTRITLFTVAADSEMAREVIAMLKTAVEREADRVQQRLAVEEMTDEQANNDIRKALAVQAELSRYEQLLEEPLTALKARTESLVLKIATRGMDLASRAL